MTTVTLVVATRGSSEDFFARTATGKSLNAVSKRDVGLRLFVNNKRSLALCYNSIIEQSRDKDEILVFAHDDLHLMDYYWPRRIAEGLEQFDIIGLAGNRRRLPRQPSWIHVDLQMNWDERENLSGSVAHGSGFPEAKVARYGDSPAPVKLLDGLLIACRTRTFVHHDLRFDPRFKFHFYDMDLCRQAEQKGLACGTWPIAAAHESKGGYNRLWQSEYLNYLKKWKE